MKILFPTFLSSRYPSTELVNFNKVLHNFSNNRWNHWRIRFLCRERLHSDFIEGKKVISGSLPIRNNNNKREDSKESLNAFLIHAKNNFYNNIISREIFYLDVFQDNRHNFSIILFLSKNKLRSKCWRWK